MDFLELFQYSFFTNALLVGIPVAICAALLGVNLVLKGYSMIGDGLSHASFGIMAAALAMNASPLYISVPAVGVVAFLLLKLDRKRKGTRADAAIAMVSASALAAGYIVTKLSGGTNINISDYMFGSILTVSDSEVVLSFVLCLVVFILYLVFYNRLFAVTLDEEYSCATGLQTERYNLLLALMTSVVVVTGMRLMGTLLISGMMIFPAMTSMCLIKSYRGVVILSGVLSLISFITGMFFSTVFSTPPGASIVLASLAFFIVCKIISIIKAKVG